MGKFKKIRKVIMILERKDYYGGDEIGYFVKFLKKAVTKKQWNKLFEKNFPHLKMKPGTSRKVEVNIKFIKNDT